METQDNMEMGQEHLALLKDSEDTPLTGKKKPKKDQKLLILVLVALLAFFIASTIVLAALFGYHEANDDDESSSERLNNVCTTGTCVEATSFLRKGMNLSANPCEDFYKYSCGNWEDSNVIPEGFGRYSSFSELGTSNSIALKKALEQSVSERDIEAVSKARYMYAKCMDVETLNQRGPVPLQEIVTRTGGWSLINVDESLPPWSIVDAVNLEREHYYGSDSFFTFYIEADDFDSNVVVIKVP